MDGKTRLAYAAGLVIVLLAVVFGARYSNKAALDTSPTLQGASVQAQAPRPVTLLEAWDLADARVKSWKANSGIAYLESVDTAGDSASSGQDGRRRAWLAHGLDPNSSVDLVVRIVDGTVAEEFTQHADVASEQIIAKPNLDSPKAIAIARAAKPLFGPADDQAKSQGFHYTIEGVSGSTTMTVAGAFNSNPAFVRLDADTSAISEALTQTIAQAGGILYSTDAGQTWQASNLVGRMVTSVYPDPTKADRAYATTRQDGMIETWRTDDGGGTWSFLGNLPKTAGDWASQMAAISGSSRKTILVLCTSSGLWISDDGTTWASVPGLPGAPSWLEPVQSNSEYRLFVSILSAPNQGVYASSDLSNWKEVAKGSYRLSQSFDRQSVLATDEFQVGNSFVLTATGDEPSNVPGTVLRAVGDFNDPASMVLDDSREGVGRLANQQVKRTTNQSGASLAVPPDFPASHVVVLGGFRTGMFRSVDSGRTWIQTLSDPATIVSGSDEIGDVQFLDNTRVIAVNGGDWTWQSF